MKSIKKVVFAVVVGFFAIFPLLGNAQNPPTVMCGSYRVAQGDSCNNGYAPAYDGAGRPLGIRVGDIRGGQMSSFQQYGQVASAVSSAGLNNCELGGAAIGGGLGYAITEKKNHIGGAVIGALLGAVAGDKYCESQAQQTVVQPQQRVAQQQRSQTNIVCSESNGNPKGSRPGRLNLPGDSKNGEVVCAMPGDQNISRWL